MSMERIRGRTRAGVVALALMSGLPGCQEREVDTPARAEMALSGETRENSGALLEESSTVDSPGSLEELSLRVLELLGEKDAAGLEGLRVSRDLYLCSLLPEFLRDRKPGNLPFELHWMLIDSESRAGIPGAVQDFGGRDLELLEIDVSRGTEDYASFRLYRKVRLEILDRQTGQSGRARIFDSVVEIDGRFLILSYPS